MPVRLLIVEDDPVVREPLAALLSARGYEVVTAADEPDALGAMRVRRPDLVLLDITLSRGSGLRVLDRIRSHERFNAVPVLMLTGDNTRETVLRCASAGANDYYLKAEFQMEGLLERIERCLHAPPPKAAAQEGESRDAEPASDRFALFDRTPSAREVLRFDSLSFNAARAIRTVIEQDSMLSAQLVAFAKASRPGTQERIDGIDRAMAELGFHSTRLFVLAFALSRELTRRAGSPLDRVALWVHGLFAAHAAAALAEAGRAPADDATLAALLHDVGLLISDEAHGAELEGVARTAEEAGVPLHDVERTLHGIDHAAAAGRACARWGLPAAVSAAVASHHLAWAEVEEAHQGDLRPIAIVRLADLIARATGRAALCDRLSPCEEELATLGASRDDVARAVREADATFEASLPLYLGAGARIARTARRGTILRSVGVVCPEAPAIDPVALALGGDGGAAVRESRDMKDLSLAEFDGVVISVLRREHLHGIEPWVHQAEETKAPHLVCVLPSETSAEERAALTRPGWKVLSWPVSRAGLLDALEAAPPAGR